MRIAKETSNRPKLKCDRLAFLRNFMRVNNISNKEAAEMLGYSAPNVSYIFTKQNDTKLSIIQKIVEMRGYVITYRLDKEGVDPGQFIDLNDVLLSENGNVQLKKLTFISVALRKYGMNKQELADKMELWVTSVRNWFRDDEIYISRVYQIAEVLGLNLYINIVPKAELSKNVELPGKAKKASKAKSNVIFEMKMTDVTPIE